MKTYIKTLYLVTLFFAALGCSNDDDTPLAEQNNTPTITAQTFTVAENIADNLPIGQVEANDIDGDELSFSISTNDNNLFEISEEGVLSLDDLQTLDFETAQSHTITIAVSDGNASVEAEIIIIVTDIDDTSFVTTWETTTPNETVTIPTRVGEYTYDYTIDWGDGNIQTGRTGDATHTYEAADTHTISISGDFPAIDLGRGSSSPTPEIAQSRAQLSSVERWGNIQWQTMLGAFARVNTLTVNAMDAPDLSQVTDMGAMFLFTDTIEGNFNNWDVSNATNMENMFRGSSFNQNISNWDVSNVTNMQSMFFSSVSFNQEISGWDVSNVINMSFMFADTSFNQDIGGWTLDNVTTMRFMFFQSPFNQNIGSWNVSNVTDMNQMFLNAQFNQDISNWNVDNVIDCSGFSSNAPLTPENTPNFTNCTP